MNLVKINAVFKSVSVRDGGEFTNDMGALVKYDPMFVIKFDEDINGNPTERRLKFPTSNKMLKSKLDELETYSKITLICNVELYSANAKVTPIDME